MPVLPELLLKQFTGIIIHVDMLKYRIHTKPVLLRGDSETDGRHSMNMTAALLPRCHKSTAQHPW